MEPKSAKLLHDATQASASILRFCGGKTLKDYEGDDLLRSAVERQFTILGEALVQLEANDPDTARRVENVRNIIGFRNRLMHGYSAVSNETVWLIVQKDLPPLATNLDGLLKNLE
jgi:uncharacterized protein with HEPN domain